MYNTVPDLEASEAQPLVAAPRKLGKTLVVVALFGFAAGAAVATAAPHVAAKMNLVAEGDEMDTNPAAYYTSGKLSTDNNKWYIGEDAEEVTAAPAAIETDVTPQVVNHCAPNCAEDGGALGVAQGGETVGKPASKPITDQKAANKGGVHISGRK